MKKYVWRGRGRERERGVAFFVETQWIEEHHTALAEALHIRDVPLSWSKIRNSFDDWTKFNFEEIVSRSHFENSIAEELQLGTLKHGFNANATDISLNNFVHLSCLKILAFPPRLEHGDRQFSDIHNRFVRTLVPWTCSVQSHICKIGRCNSALSPKHSAIPHPSEIKESWKHREPQSPQRIRSGNWDPFAASDQIDTHGEPLGLCLCFLWVLPWECCFWSGPG